MTSKYDPLGDYLKERLAAETPMSFREIERVIGSPLPPKAVNHPAWWSNNTSNNTMTKVWLDAGFRTERVDVAGRKLVFRRVAPAKSVAVSPSQGIQEAPSSGLRPSGFLAWVRAMMAGTVHVPEGVDLTAPTGELWEAEGS